MYLRSGGGGGSIMCSSGSCSHVPIKEHTRTGWLDAVEKEVVCQRHHPLRDAAAKAKSHSQ